jgi:hypothetical protein
MKVKSPRFAAFLSLLRNHWPRRTIVMETVETVLFGAIGVRSCSGAVRAENLNPIYVVIAAIIFVVLFVFALLTIVHIVTS